jgi:hypothetical protein
MNKPKNWMSEPAAGMELIASIQLEHPGLSHSVIAQQTGVSLYRLKRIDKGMSRMSYIEQVALERLLTFERVAQLHERWCNTIKRPTFWERHLQGDKT